ncbi:MAG: GntR family transcriptional regulator, partial [Gammaproteobacteria bacterium]|nr:GntR family transcriptional regulator [Gammaproteobacteria bacterium]
LDSGSADACREAIDYHIGVARHFVVKGVGETGDSSDEESADEDVLPR